MQKNYTSIFKRVLDLRRFSSEEENEIRKKVNLFAKTLTQYLKKERLSATLAIGGSAAKGTFLKGDFDVDIFVRFAYSYKDKDISKLLGRAVRHFKKSVLVHGSRDYFQVEEKGISYEIIPVLYVTQPKKALNVTDMSPLHVSWVKNHLTLKKKADILLAKLFCKSIGVYGAESYIKGFSGHVLDILIVHYGSFLTLLKKSATWKEGTIIDVSKHKTAKELNKSKVSPLILIDPVDPSRNAAAALSTEKIERFKYAAKKFLQAPSSKFFEVKKVTPIDLKKKAGKNKLILVGVESKKGKIDVVGAKLLKVYEHIVKELHEKEFVVKNTGWTWDKEKEGLMWFIVDKKALSKTKIHEGPPLASVSACKAFKKKYRKVISRKGRLYTTVKRPYTDSRKLISDTLKQPYVKERVKRVSLVK